MLALRITISAPRALERYITLTLDFGDASLLGEPQGTLTRNQSYSRPGCSHEQLLEYMLRLHKTFQEVKR